MKSIMSFVDNTLQKLIVMKFGGSCLIDNESFEQIIRIIDLYRPNGSIILTTSALSGITDKLMDFYILQMGH